MYLFMQNRIRKTLHEGHVCPPVTWGLTATTLNKFYKTKRFSLSSLIKNFWKLVPLLKCTALIASILPRSRPMPAELHYTLYIP